MRCLRRSRAIATLDETFSELDHLRVMIQSLADQLTNEPYWDAQGADTAVGSIMDHGMLVSLANERLEWLIAAGRALSQKET